MFKKIKDKLAEEMKQSPARLQAGMQQLAQVVSPALSSTSIQDLSASNDNFSLTEETDTETPRNSPAKHGFQSVNLTASSDNGTTGASRRSSISSITSDASFLFPSYESPANSYNLQSDMDQSASEVDDNISPQLDRVTKDQLYSAYRNVQMKHRKYRDKYRELASHYRDIQRNASKLESLLEETQDKALRRIADLKEQCLLEQQAKAHLEELLRNDIDEKECLISSLNTKIALLQKENTENGETTENHTSQPLIDLNNEASSAAPNESLIAENEQLKNKLSMLEVLNSKLKSTLKRTKENLTQENNEKLTIERDFNVLKSELEASRTSVAKLTDELDALRKREEEAAISLAENKLSIYRELESKEEQIKKQNQELDSSAKMVEKYRTEVEELRAASKNEYADVLARCQEEQRRNDELTHKLEEFEKLLSEAKEKTIRESDVIEKLNSKFEENSAEVIVLRSKNEKVTELLEKERVEKGHMQAMCEELQKTVQAMDKEVLKLGNAVSEKEKLLETKESELSSITTEHATCKMIVDELKAKMQEIRSQVTQLIQEKQTQTQKMKGYQNQIQQLKKDSEEMRKHVELNFEQRKKEMKVLSGNLLDVLSKFNPKVEPDSDSEAARLRSQNEKQSKECSNLKREWEVRTAQVHQLMLLVEDLEMKHHKLVDDNKQLRATLQSNNMHWLETEEEYKKKTEKQLEEMIVMRKENLALAAEIETANEKLKHHTASHPPAVKKVAGKKRNQSESFSKVEELQQIIDRLNVQLGDLENENYRLRVEIATLYSHMNMATEEKEKLIEENKRQATMYSKLEDIRQSQNETINSLESKMRRLLKERQSESESSESSPYESMDSLDSKAQQHCSKTSKKLEELKISENKRVLKEKMSMENVDLVVSKKIENLLLEKEALDAENIVLKQREKELALKNEEVEKNNQKQKEMISNFESKMSQLDLGKDESSKRLSELVTLNQDLASENKLLKDKLNELVQVNENLEQSIKQLNEVIARLEEKIQLLESENSRWKNELETSNKSAGLERKKLEESFEQRGKAISEMENKIKSLEIELNKWRNTNGELESTKKSLLNEKSKLEAKVEQQKELISKMENKIKNLEEESKKLNNFKSELEKAVQMEKEGLKKQLLELETTRKKLEDSDNRNAKLKKEVEEMNLASMAKVKELEIKHAETNNKFEEQAKLNDELRNENKVLKDKENELVRMNEESRSSQGEKVLSLQKKITDLEGVKLESEKRLEEQTKLNNDLREKSMNMEKERNELLKKKESLEKKNLELNKLNTDLESKKKKLEEDCKKRESELQQTMQKKINELEVACKKLSVQNSELQTSSSSFSETNTALKSQLEDLGKKYAKSTEEVQRLEEIEKKLVTENNIVKDELKQMQTSFQEMQVENKNLQDRISVLSLQVQNQADYEQLTVELNSLRDSHSHLTSENDKMKDQIKNLESQNHKFLEETQILEKKLQTISGDYSSQKMRLVELSGVCEEVEQLRKMVIKLKSELMEKTDELNQLQMKNESLSKSIEKMNEASNLSSDKLKETEKEKAGEIDSLRVKNNNLLEELQSRDTKNKELEAQLDETLVTFQTKEAQMMSLNEELKKKVEELKSELTLNGEEQTMRLKQLAKEFQAQLHDKDEELQAALEKRFDQQQAYESDLVRQYKEQLKDFQVELTAKSEQIENLILDRKENAGSQQEEVKKLMESIEQLKKSHANELKEVERKWKNILDKKTAQLESKHEEEVNELTNEWQNERKTNTTDDLTSEELESTSRVAMAAVQSNTGSFHTLQQTLLSQKRELTELRKLVKLRHETLEDSTEIEYLRNILFEYMMGKETLVLAKVIAAVVKFDQDQTLKIIKKEEDKLTLLGSLGLS